MKIKVKTVVKKNSNKKKVGSIIDEVTSFCIKNDIPLTEENIAEVTNALKQKGIATLE